MSATYFGDPGQRDPISPFIAMLWERGTLYELAVSGELTRPALQFDDLAESNDIRGYDSSQG